MSRKERIFFAILLSLYLIGGGEPGLAQGTNLGTIRGTVTDANGSVVAGARVEVTDLETSLAREVATNGEGNYEVSGLKFGRYRVNVTAQGFKAAVIGEVALRGGETVRADALLQVGSTSETVEVVAATTINLETPTVSGALTNRELLELPRDNRDIYSFLYLNPNITQSGSDGTFKFLGAQSYGASFSLDGQRANGGIFGEPTASQPSLETIGELIVRSNNFSAEYAGIANISVTTKRGGSTYHGSLFYNNKNSALAAWSVGDKRGEAQFTPTPAVDKFPTPYFNLNEVGGSFGGPVPFSREKTFFLLAYERRWNASPVRFRGTGNTSLPHATLYTGDFSLVNNAAKPVVPAGIMLTEAEIAANTILVGGTRRFVTIPQRLLNPTTAAFIQTYFPVTSVKAPINPANGRLVDFFENVGGLVTRDLGTLRVDHDLTAKDKLTGVYNVNYGEQRNSAVVSPYVGLGLTNNDRQNHTLSLSYTRIFSPNLINEARGGFNFQFLFRTSNTTPTSFLESIGFDQSDLAAYYGVVGENARPTFGHVGVAFANGFATFGTGGRNTFRPLDQKLYTFGDTLTWVFGRHSIKAGFDVVRNSALDGFANNRGNPRGLLTYSGGSGTDRFARFLLGLPATTAAYVDRLRTPMDVYNWEQGYFVQDDFKLNPKLTLYLGLRYELVTPFIERNDLLVNFDPNFTDPASGRKGRFIIPSERVLAKIDPRIINYGVVTADEVGVGRGLVKTDTNNLAPRLGAAWRVTEKTVIRGGYGIFYPTAAAQGMRDAIATNPFNQARTKNNTIAPLAGWPGFSHGFSPFSGGTLQTVGSQPSANAIPLDLSQPRIEQYNATVERELPKQVALRISYLGTRSRGLIAGIDLNMLPPSDAPFGTTTGDGVTPCTPGEDCELSPADIARRPFPTLGDFLATYGNTGRGKSHALQVEVGRRFANNFEFHASYTLIDQKSSALDTGNSSLGGTAYNQFKPENDYGTDAFISRHRFIAYGVVELPFGRGQKFGSGAPKAVDLIAGGWQLSWQMFAKSGIGFTPSWGCDNCDPVWPGNVGSGFVDANGGFNGASFRPLVVGAPQQRSGDRYFDPEAFAPPPIGADVFDNPQVAKRNLLRGPGAWGANLGLDKSFRIGERVRLKVGAEFNNVFNHPLLSPDFGTGAGIANLGTFSVKVDPATRRLQLDSVDRNPDFGRFFDSFSQENIENRRVIRLTLRLTF